MVPHTTSVQRVQHQMVPPIKVLFPCVLRGYRAGSDVPGGNAWHGLWCVSAQGLARRAVWHLEVHVGH